MKKLLILMLLFAINMPAFAQVKLEDMELQGVKPPAYRLGLTDDPERPYEEVQTQTNIEQKEAVEKVEETPIEYMTYADLSIKNLSKEISKEISLDEK